MTYTKTVTLPVTPDEAFDLVTQPERLRRWMTVSAYVDLRAGGSYRWTVVPGAHAAGTVREVEPGRRVVLGWGWEEGVTPAVDGSTVTLTIEPAAGGSQVTLTHEGLDAAEEANHAEGWDHFLERLEAAAGTGDAGQDPWGRTPQGMSPTVAAEAALAAIQPVLRAITDADADRPTPCPELPVGALVDHLVTSFVQLGGMADATISETGGSAEHRVSTVVDETITAWRAVDLDGTVPGPAGPMPATIGAGLLGTEILLHGWDLAQALSRTIDVSDEVVAYIHAQAEPIIPTARGRSFADEVDAPEGASPLDRLAAFAGRSAVEQAVAR
jgi:uncharacterized protein (TIGR03086 family)